MPEQGCYSYIKSILQDYLAIALNCTLGISMALTLSWPSTVYSADKNEIKINQIKAAYLFNLLKFTSWPDEHLNQSPNLNICITGNNPVAKLLSKGLQNRKAHNKVLRITYIPDSLDNAAQHSLSQCHFLYLAGSDIQQNKKILQHSYQQPILTVSDNHDFCKQGGMVELKNDPKQDKIIILINRSNADLSGIRFSSKLLRLATLL